MKSTLQARSTRRAFYGDLLWLVVLMPSCSHPPVHRTSDSLSHGQWHHARIDSLVAATDLPEKQSTEVLPIGHWSNNWLIRVKYGDKNDESDPANIRAGDRYVPIDHFRIAYGLQHGDKVGWMWFEGIEREEMDHITIYEFDANDAFLGSAEFLRAVEATDIWFFQNVFRHRLAESTAVGLPALAAVTHTLYRWGDDRLARILIENPLVRADRETLFALAGLPQYDDGTYSAVRNEARKLLGMSQAGN